MSSESANVVIDSDTSNNIIVATYKNVIKKEDFQVFYDLLEKAHNQFGDIRVLVYFDDSFKGWEKDAAELNFKSVSEYVKHATHLAYVNPDPHKMLQMKIASPLVKGELRFFNTEDYEKALNWIKE